MVPVPASYEKKLENPIPVPVPCWYVEKSKPDQDGFTGPVTALIDLRDRSVLTDRPRGTSFQPLVLGGVGGVQDHLRE
jgi:hypothetical protein